MGLFRKEIPNIFTCSKCGYVSKKWLGRCPACGTFDTFADSSEKKKDQPPEPQKGIVKETIIERQVFVIRCAYCGNVYPAEKQKCPSCGGR